MFGKWVCVCVQVRKCRYVYVVAVAAASLAVLAGAVRLSLAMLPRPVVRQQRKSGRGQLAERLCRITPLVLWSKALERSSMGLPHGAADPAHAEDAAGGP